MHPSEAIFTVIRTAAYTIAIFAAYLALASLVGKRLRDHQGHEPGETK